MARAFLTELALFLLPFAVYALFLWATKAQILHPESWPTKRLAWLTIVALVLMVGGIAVLVHFDGEAPDSVYVPAHMEDGRLVPGQYIPRSELPRPPEQ